MRKTNFTFLTQQLRNLTLILLAVVFNASLDAQCSLVCNGGINVSLDGTDCTVTLDAVDLLNGEETTCTGGVFEVHILDHHGNLINETGEINFDHVGEELQYKVVEESGNSCWGWVTVEDKYAPVIICEEVMGPFYCYDLIDYEPQIEMDCDGDDVSIDLVNEVVMTNNCSDYGPDTLMKVTRTYIATDLSGNESEPCTFEFFVERLPDWNDVTQGWDNMTTPPSLLKSTDTGLQCDDDYPKDNLGNPSPLPGNGFPGTGVPEYVTMDSTYKLYPNDNQFCNLLVNYDDQEIFNDGCVIKIMRRWSIIEWSCESPQRASELFQVIEIVDDKGPELTAPDNITASTNDYNCGADVYIAALETDDNCSEEVTVDLAWTGGGSGYIPGFEGGFVPLDTGLNILTFTAYDECGNSSQDVTEVFVEDKTPPVAICDQFTVVSLTTDGVAWAHASVFDDGSYDECKLGHFEVRRMDGDVCDEDEDGDTTEDDEFGEYVKFCCEDVGRTDIMVVFRVYDKAGNYNDCMVNVEIQDKLPPKIVCPPDLTIECGFNFTDHSVFGTVQQNKDDIEPITIHDDYLIDWAGGIGALTDGYAEDNCIVRVTVDSVEVIDQCNLGFIYRTFTATDAGGRTDQCTQTITIKNSDPFDGLTDITWPRDTLITGCQDPTSGEFHPDEIGYPTYDEDECNLIGTSYEDHVFPFNNNEGDACFKILRKWKVIDWCQFEEDVTGTGNPTGNSIYDFWTWTQVIKVNNEVDPIITGTYPRVEVCTFDPTCTDGFIELNATATDDCTATLKASWKIDANNDGSFDIFSEDVLGTVIQNSISATGTYPIGSHRIEWTFIDFCGNKTTIDQLFDIVNCKAPTPYCINGLAVDLMPIDEDNDGVVDGGMVELWASDFDAGSFHTCEGYEVFLSFTPDIADSNMVFDCSHVGDQQVTIYASVITPMDSIIQSFCITSLSVQDNMMACGAGGGGQRVSVSGAIATEDALQIEEVSVALVGSELSDQMTNTNGQYAFADMSTGGTYEVVPSKTDDPDNGVSTLDLVYIQRHILGIDKFESPYKMIAADINADGKISASDILELRKLILGINDDFSNNDSWKFVDQGHGFADANEALDLGYPETYQIETLDNNMVVNFMGVKIGDVNNNATTSKLQRGTTTRSNQVFNLTVDNATCTDGETIAVDVKAGDYNDLIGLQATLAIDPSITIVGVEGGLMDMTNANMNLNNQDQGQVTLSWNTSTPIAVNEGDVLFTLEIESQGEGSLANTMSIVDNPLTAEVYNNVQDIMSLTLNVENSTEEFSLMQNTPNPFNEVTEIRFMLPKDMNVTFTVFDVTGKVVKMVHDNFNAGMNQIRITKDELETTGVMYYQLEAGQFTATKKMVILQ
ncbi:MAG: T9SS type A sorting domain-containing protein [Saprospiraceae bacterium]|nr:T9SS type A sorting domain-containing protein [Saprospiraceae bacterium]